MGKVSDAVTVPPLGAGRGYCKPILFSRAMVRANRARIKNQTRRTNGLEEVNRDPDRWDCVGFRAEGPDFFLVFEDRKCPGEFLELRSKWGGPGGLLWVKENYRFSSNFDGMKPSEVGHLESVAFEADDDPDLSGRWRPGVFMPRWVSRTLLRIMSVRAERVQSITEADAWAEGCPRGGRETDGTCFPAWVPGARNDDHQCDRFRTPPDCSARSWYADLFNSINGELAWESNPWVVVIRYEIQSDLRG